MKKRFGGLSLAAAVLATTGLVEACTAESMVDQARGTRQDDAYRSARDVAQEFIDAERFVNDVYTLDAGTGSLLWEKDVIGAMERGKGNPLALPLPTGTTRDQLTAYWRGALDRVSGAGAGHGLSAAGAKVTGMDCTIRDHMRQHVKEWSDALNGDGTLALKQSRLRYKDAVSAPSSAPAPAPVPSAAPVRQPPAATRDEPSQTTWWIIRSVPPAPPASAVPSAPPAPAAAPAPVPHVDHAG